MKNSHKAFYKSKSVTAGGMCVALAGLPSVYAADDAGGGPIILDQVKVIGEPDGIEEIPGSAHVLTEEDIRTQSYDDVNRVLRKVPGVYLREEDGFGLFPNISIRGVDTSRSAKLTLMEDGVLTAPAPYSAPAAYYSPTAGRMSGIEVLKGTSQIRYGPHITGGVINYLSTPIPFEHTAYLKSIYGTDNEIRVHGYTGDTIAGEVGHIGYLLEGYFRTTDGFKTIDLTPDFRNGEDTGFTNVEPMLKLSWEPPTTTYQRFEFKYGYTDRDANETYLGLSEEDFKANPFRRYAASRFDNIDTEHHRTYLRHFFAPTDNLDIITTAYYSTFNRNWFKLHDLRNIPGVGNLSLSGALAGEAGGVGLAVLKGEAAGTLRIRNNNREYYLKGIESVAHYRFETGDSDHELAVGVRYHSDRERRFQRDELFTQEANGTISDRDPGTPGNAGDRLEETDALAIYIKDRIEIGKWAITPGIRYEYLDQNHEDFAQPDSGGTNTLDLFAGGIGISYRHSNEWNIFGGVHRGFSPPGPRSAIIDGLNEETSIGMELGARYTHGSGALTAEAIGFFTRFEDLIVIDNIGGTGTGNTENFGKVDSYGVEFLAQLDAGIANNWGFKNPYFLTLTYTNAEQRSDAVSTDPESIFSFGRKGNKVPYIPELTLTVGSGLEFARWGINVTASYSDETFTSASNTSEQVDGLGNPDARFGKTDDFIVVDLAGHINLKKGIRAIAGVHNLFDEEYIASRQPHGPRPGKARFSYIGLEFDF